MTVLTVSCSIVEHFCFKGKYSEFAILCNKVLYPANWLAISWEALFTCLTVTYRIEYSHSNISKSSVFSFILTIFNQWIGRGPTLICVFVDRWLFFSIILTIPVKILPSLAKLLCNIHYWSTNSDNWNWTFYRFAFACLAVTFLATSVGRVAIKLSVSCQ